MVLYSVTSGMKELLSLRINLHEGLLFFPFGLFLNVLVKEILPYAEVKLGLVNLYPPSF